MVMVIFGVAGVGKTTIGKLLAGELGWKFYDADDFQPDANIEKMKRGEPLTDRDRRPWLESIRGQLKRSVAAKENAVLACSALKRQYRDRLRVSAAVKFVFLHANRARVAEQLKQRGGHFFDPKLLGSQFADLEEPESMEDALKIQVRDESGELVREIKEKMGLQEN